MSQRTSHDFAIERKALDAVLASGAFVPSSNPARLLAFLCERYFESPGREVAEHEIATGALGRRSDFDPRSDSVVRVEMHRLRKRLKEFYQGEGAWLRTQIVLPPGQYAPRFVALDEAEAGGGAPPRRSADPRRGRIWLGLAAILLLAAATWAVHSHRANFQTAARAAAPPGASSQPEVRLLAGFLSGKYIDQSGHLWGGDAHFQSGSAVEVRYNRLDRTADPALYQHARQGFDFSYDIPLKAGSYEMRLYFAESSMRVPIVGEKGEALRRFQVMANGKRVLPPPDGKHVRQFDIFSDAGGDDLADVKVFRDIAPATDGKLHLRFLADKEEAIVNAIEIVPGEPGRIRPIRLCADNRSIVDNRGNLWLPDSLAQGGRLSAFNRPIGGTDTPALFQGERFGHFTYTIPVAPGRYTVSLGFAENYHTVWDRLPGAGARLFNVYINGVSCLRDFDVYVKAGGALRAMTRAFRDVQPTPQDKITITFEPVTEAALVNTVEVSDQGEK